jgi:polyhydroxybutyrate depolymerase
MKLSFALCLFFFSSFLSSKLKAQSAFTDDSLLVAGNYRVFHFHQPEAGATNASLVFVMHGSGGNGKQMAMRTDKLEALSAAENFLVVYPDAYKHFWNECRKVATTEANELNIDEVAFFEAMIDYFKKNYGIRETQVFAMGTSGGGHMAYKLALLAPKKFKAIAAIIANLPDDQNMDCSESKIALPVMIINGTADPVNPYAGGMMHTGNFKAGTVRSTDETFHYWAGLAGYKGNPGKQNLPDTDPADGKKIERYTFSAKGKPEVVLLKVIGGRHDYPGDIDVHVEAWKFFKRQIGNQD